MTRRSWIGIHAQVTQKRQCVLASVVRGTVYAQRKPKSPDGGDEVLKRLIDEEYTRHPFRNFPTLDEYQSTRAYLHLGSGCITASPSNRGASVAPSSIPLIAMWQCGMQLTYRKLQACSSSRVNAPHF